MRKLGIIQEFFGKMLMRKRAKKLVRTPKATNLDLAERIGIVYDANSQKNHRAIVSFAQEIAAINSAQVHLLGFLTNEEYKSSFSGQFGCKYITKKDFNVFGIPRSHVITDYMKQPFDILIDCTTIAIYPINYISILSKATFKVGRLSDKTMHLDLLIDVKNHGSVEYLISQIRVYLSMIHIKK